MRPGLSLAHKPLGATSFSLVQAFATQAAAARGGKRPPVCHGGTLDPFAHGLLLLLLGPATRLFPFLHSVPKTYVAEVVWGAETDTGDAGGKVVACGDTGALTPERLKAALEAHLGWQQQVPPATSAKKVGGEPAYKKAHRGEAVELPPSRVYLHAARWLSHRLPHASTLELTCRGGYYVRALARDVGRQLGCGAHLVGLHRTAIGPWQDPGPGSTPLFVGGKALLPWLPSRPLDDAEKGLLKRGEALPRGRLLPPPWPLPPGFPPAEPHVRALHQDKLVALLRPEGEQLLPEVALTGGL